MLYLNPDAAPFGRKGLLLILMLAWILPVKAQFFPNSNPVLWFKSNPQEALARDSMCIGNYRALDLADATVLQQVDDLESQRKGTLFVVLGTTDSLTQDELFGFGGVSVYRDHLQIRASAITFDRDLGKAPAIVRAAYSYGNGNRNIPNTMRVAPGTYITEVLFFKKVLDQEEVRKVETYLALKYSINITENTNPRLRDYVDGSTNSLWNVRTDVYFNDEVMALGRVDSLAWFQSQTRSADSKSITISLDSSSIIAAQMPASNLGNNSMLILSKSNFSPRELRCGEGLSHRLWKLKLQDWQYTGSAFYITLNEELSPAEYPMLSDGFDSLVLAVQVVNGKSRITVPIIPNMYNHPHYLMWGAAGISCDPLCNVFVRTCTGNNSGSIELNLDPAALPAQMELYNLVTNQSIQATLTEPITLIENLNNGRYQLNVQNRSLQLVDQLVELNNCPPGNGLDPTLDSFLGANSAIADNSGQSGYGQNNNKSPYRLTQSSAKQGIIAFPNPAFASREVTFNFNGLNDRRFKVVIFDDAGEFHSSEEFTPTEEQPGLTHTFDLPGTYFVRFYAGDYSAFIQVVINN